MRRGELRTWRVDAGPQTLVLASTDGGLPACVHWGPSLPAGEDPGALARAAAIDSTGGMLDRNPDLTLCPEAERAFPGHPGLILHTADGAPVAPRFETTGDRRDGAGLSISAEDARLGLRLTFRFDADGDILTARTVLEADAPVRVHWLAAPVLPASQLSDHMIDVSGRWIGEFQLNRVPWTPGQRARENRTGRTGHEHFPALVIPDRGTTNTRGVAAMMHYGWSGGHRMVAEELPDGRRQVQWGHAPGTETSPATRFETAPLILALSDGGLNGPAAALQRHIRDRVVPWPDRSRPRPVHYNCWEAVYFDHDPAVLADIASRAASLGAERFVLDDGWFRGRDDDTSSLGDWEVDPRKWPDGLTPFIDHVHRLGMTFGLWFEPEMTNPDSDLRRSRPDWILGAPDQCLGRGQMALDMAREDVRDHLFDKISAILSGHDIEYVKWDHNRVLPEPGADRTRGTYALIDRLRAAFPSIEIETCASGGGRVDAGILSRAHRVWPSDSNDALERLRIQHDAALFLPAAVTGSHVGPRRCHTSGRVLDISFRAWVAAQRHMGFEMDPRELTDHEAEVLSRVTAWWRENRGWMMEADILRLDSPDPAVVAEQQLSRDGSRFVVFAGKAATSSQIAPRPLRLTRLDPGAFYEVDIADRGGPHPLSRGETALSRGALRLSGAALTNRGLTPPWSFPETMWVVEGRRVDD